MKIFLYEQLCACGGVPQCPSLLLEGRAMLEALAADMLRLPDVDVATLAHSSLRQSLAEAVERLQVVACGGREQEHAMFYELCENADAVLAIAPEFNGVLAERCRWAATGRARWLGCSLSAVQRCTDKLRLAEHLARRQIPCIGARSADLSAADPPPEQRFPLVVKPRDGAGSLNTYLLRNRQQWSRRRDEIAAAMAAAGQQAIVQDFVNGTAVSTAAILPPGGGEPLVLPAGRQRLANDGRFTYLGGQIPAAVAGLDERAATLIRRCCAALPGLSGFVGFDLIWQAPTRQLTLVEINPRLTTSYIGYRAQTADNLAGWLLERAPPRPPRWRADRVEFDPDGKVRRWPAS
jgi:predicted ATP-grasp superfamily ATP-dependent carboligase